MKDHLKQKSPRTAVGDHEHPIKMDDVKVIQSEDNMKYISLIKFHQWMFSNMNNCNEWDTQETQPLELTHRLIHICCQIPSLSTAGLGYDQQCYQWFTGKLNCFMDTYLFSSAGQSTEAIHSVAKWSLSYRFMFSPYCIFVTQMSVMSVSQ